jgi:hypothetical protein
VYRSKPFIVARLLCCLVVDLIWRNLLYLPVERETLFRLSLKGLSEQLGRFDLGEYAGYRVDLRGHRKDIYGLVLASYVRRKHEDDDQRVFGRRVKKCGGQHGLRHWDLPNPQLDLVYANEPVTILGGGFNASLYAGLWRLAD